MLSLITSTSINFNLEPFKLSTSQNLDLFKYDKTLNKPQIKFFSGACII